VKVVAIIQARMSSTRLPGKVLADVCGQPLLHHVVCRARCARTPDQVVVATSDRPADDAVVRFCEMSSVPCFRGSEEDVLDRYYQAARHFQAETVVRLTADCPLLDPDVVDRVVRAFGEGDRDYVSNTLDRTYPDGLDVEVFSFTALARAWREARLPSEREHVTPYIWKHPELFRLGNVKQEEDLSDLRWTVDEPRDLAFVRAVYRWLGPRSDFGMKEVLALLREHPELGRINAGIERNEGYRRSLERDTIQERVEAD